MFNEAPWLWGYGPTVILHKKTGTSTSLKELDLRFPLMIHLRNTTSYQK